MKIALESPRPARPWAFLADRRFVLILAVTLAIAFYFWLTSRYPALDAKASMGATAPINGISFDTVLERLPRNGLLWDIVINSINWLYTNWKGMTFGILFGACALTLLGLIERRGFGNPFADAALGAAIGAPLGVCVNCAAPIARGLHSAGVRLETTLSAMIASPTLNVIVVTMSFALLPWHMAAIKLIASLGFVLIGVPLLTRLFFQRERAASGGLVPDDLEPARRSRLAEAMERIRPPAVPAHEIDSWAKALRWLGITLGRNLLFVIAVTLPLMILSGVLGAVLISVMPFSELARHVPLTQAGISLIIAMFVIAAVGIVLPVPIAFDVIVTSILINQGWPVTFALPLLIALGSFSIYSFLIIGRAISFRVAGGLMAALVLVAVAGGLAGLYLDRAVQARAQGNVTAYLKNVAFPTPPALPVSYGAGQPGQVWTGSAVAYQPLAATIVNKGSGTVTAEISAPMVGHAGGGAAFAKLPGTAIGLDVEPYLSGLEGFQPYSFFWAIAAGDVQGDGWIDLALANDSARGGLSLFRNRDGHYVRDTIDLGPLAKQFIGTAAFVDLDNDGLPELFVSTDFHGSYALWNRAGRFSWNDKVVLQPDGSPMIGAPAFADLDGDGRLDIVAATWSVGTLARSPYLKASSDRILWNEGASFRVQELSGIPGESLTSLVTDLNGDGRPDILIGDDISNADKIYLGQSGRRFTLVDPASGLVPYLANTTMSFDIGDIDNDLRDELYIGQISGVEHENRRTSSFKDSYCNDPLVPRERLNACYLHARSYGAIGQYANPTYPRCDQRTDALSRAVCAAQSTVLRAGKTGDRRICDPVRHFSFPLFELCVRNTGPVDTTAEGKLKSYPGAIYYANILLKPGTRGFEDKAKQFGVATPGWTWNSRFIDLDQDGWQDMYVATGFIMHRGGEPNHYFRNIGGTHFESAEKAFGLTDKLPSTTYALLDYDRDGDVDIIRPSGVTVPVLDRNDRPAGKALWVRLIDGIGNRAGVGARITIRAGANRQVREIRQSGGFASGDVPQAHFGLGGAQQVDEVLVHWRDGTTTRIAGAVPANTELVIRRR